MHLTLIVPVLLPFFVISFGHPHAHSKSGSNKKVKVVDLYKDKNFKVFDRRLMYDSNCLDYDEVDENPSPTSSAELISGGCVRLCDWSCNNYKYAVNGPKCVELTKGKPLAASLDRPDGLNLNDKIKSFSDCPSKIHQHRPPAQEEEPN